MKAVIFDFDGTIADSFETLMGIFDEISNRQEPLNAGQIAELRGMKINQIIKKLDIKKWQIPKLILQAKRLYAPKIAGIKTFAGIPDVFEALSRQGCQLYILSTNSKSNIEAYLEKNNLDKYFTRVYGDIGLRKSSALKKLVKKEGLKKTDCTYIGDEVRDVVSAKKAGLTSVGVTYGFSTKEAVEATNPDYLANSPKELLSILS